ncbi:MAG: RNA-binding protein [Candidatus Zixiibacteriota bacterium]
MQESKLYIGNLKYTVTNEQLQELCSPYGEVKSVNVIESKGFGFVEFGTSGEAEKAMEALNGQEFEGRVMRVSEARPKENRDRGERRRY